MVDSQNNIESIQADAKPSWYVRLLNPWVAIPLLLVVSLLSAPFAFRQSRLIGLPDIEEPFDVEAFLDYEVDPAENTYADYQRASSLFVEPSKKVADELKLYFETDFDFAIYNPSQEYLIWLANNQQAVLAWKAGTHKIWYKDVDLQNLRQLHQSKVGLRLSRLAYIVLASGVQLQHKGMNDQAAETFLSCYRCSKQLQRRAHGYQFIIAMMIQKKAVLRMVDTELLNSLSKTQLQKIMNEVQSLNQLDSPYSDLAKTEYIASLNEIHSLKTLAKQHRLLPYNSLTRLLHFILNDPEYSLRASKHYIKNVLTHIDKPRYLRPRIERMALFEQVGTAKDTLSVDELVDAILTSDLLLRVLPYY